MASFGSRIGKAALAAGTAAFAAAWYARKVWFYRDPVRTPELTERAIISPADGKVVYIKRIVDGHVISGMNHSRLPIQLVSKAAEPVTDGWIVGVMMTGLDSHFLYSPVSGAVGSVTQIPAETDIPMLDLWEQLDLTLLRHGRDVFDRPAHFENDRNIITIDAGEKTVTLVETAEQTPGQVLTHVIAGDKVAIAQKLGFVDRGSLVDLIIPGVDLSFHKDVGDQVYGAQTVIATY